VCIYIYIYSHFVGPFVCESIFSLQNQSFLSWNWIPYVPKSPLHVFLLCEHQGFKYRYGVQNRPPPISSKIMKIGSNSNFKMWGIFFKSVENLGLPFDISINHRRGGDGDEQARARRLRTRLLRRASLVRPVGERYFPNEQVGDRCLPHWASLRLQAMDSKAASPEKNEEQR
jgi:hypothetical protein